MRQDLTELVFILDRSGSMYGLEKDTVGGFNSVLQSNLKLPGSANVTTILFNHEAVLLHDRLPIAAVKPMTAADYRPAGSTALLDAVGMAISKIEAVQRSVSDEYRAAKVQFVIVTDGMENASTHYHLPEIRRLIAYHREHDGWDFLFLGANMDAVEVAESMAIHPDRAVTAMADSIGTAKQYDAIATATVGFRCESAPLNASWKEEVEADLASRGTY